jgi:hypothetical protein
LPPHESFRLQELKMTRSAKQLAMTAMVVFGFTQAAFAKPRPRAVAPAGMRETAPPPPRDRVAISDDDFVDGVCYFPAQSTVPNDQQATKLEAACQARLLGMSGSVSVPGLVFVGLAFGKSAHFLIVPAASIGAGLTVPFYRPQLECDLVADNGPRKGQYSCDIPLGIHFVASFIASLNIAFGEMFFPSAGSGGSQAQEFGTPLGAFGGVELGMAEYAKGRTRYKLALDLGIVLGLLPQSTTVGTSGIFGFQPGISIQF